MCLLCIFYRCVIVTCELIYIDIIVSGCENVIPLLYNKLTLNSSQGVGFMCKVHTTTFILLIVTNYYYYIIYIDIHLLLQSK